MVLIAVQLAVLRDSQRHIRSQDAKLTALYSAGRGAIHDAGPVVGQVQPLVGRAARALRALSAAGPGLSGAAAALPPLLRAGQALADAGIPLARELDAVGTPRVVAQAGALLNQIDSTGLVGKAAAGTAQIPDLLRLQKRSLRAQVESLKVQRESLRIQVSTLAAVRESLVHIESLDRKTGGPPPALPTATP